MAPQPHERILEIGCGTGKAAELVAATLTTGRMLAIDRSPHAIAAAVDRTAAAIDRGVLQVSRGTLAALADAGPFDVAFAINVNVFWTEAADDELATLARVLAPGGRLGILFGTGPHDGSGILPLVAGKLERHGFRDVAVVTDARGSGVVARK